MSSKLADRLRGVVAAGLKPGATTESTPDVVARGFSRADSAIADVLGGEWQEGRGQRYLVVDRTYGPGHRHGRLAVMDCLPPWPKLGVLRGSKDLRSLDPRERTLFIDIETTGLAGGAGTYAFLVGCAWFDGPVFRVRQFFLSAYAAEPALLEGVARFARDVTGVVSFNGKSFDLPLIETRFLFHRMDTPFASLPHVDMLHPARRLWRGEEHEAAGTTASCRLSVLEQVLCGVARDGDVPGFEIPGRYFTYVRTGDPRPLAAVFEHNRLDLVSLALVTAHAARLLEEGPGAARTAREALGLGRLYERSGLCDEALEAYKRAAGIGPAEAGPHIGGDALTRAEALRCYAVLCRRERRFADAAAAWQRVLEVRRCPPQIVREATEALAVHHEHRLRDPHAARRFALQSLLFQASVSRRHAVQHRLERLDRKLHASSGFPSRPAADSLFP